MSYNEAYDAIARIRSGVINRPLYIVREEVHPVKSTEGDAKQFNRVNIKKD